MENQHDNENMKETERDQREESIKKLATLRQTNQDAQLCFEQLVESGSVSAKLIFAKYRSLVDEGFTEQQAYQFVLTRGLS